LRGRSGRQGDPGFSRFYVSLDDELMIRFANDNLRKIFAQNGDDPIESKTLTSAITSAQKRIEGQNFDIRKNLLDYDDVLSKQRQIMYSKRDKILYANDINDLLLETFGDCGKALTKRAVIEENKSKNIVSGKLLQDLVVPRFLPENQFNGRLYEESDAIDAGEDLGEVLLDAYLHRKKTWDKEMAERLERELTLHIIDRNWTQQIDNMTRFRESVSLRSYAQVNPLQDYVNEGWAMFREMLETISLEVVLNLLNVQVQQNNETIVSSTNTIQGSGGIKPAAPTISVTDTDTKVVTEKEKIDTAVSKDAVETSKAEVEEIQEAAINVAHGVPPANSVKPALSIKDVDKNKEAAKDVDFKDIHTN
ncbi:MAG: hypothetical protein WCW63_04590, partial [Acholeplasmataceae bacterium]